MDSKSKPMTVFSIESVLSQFSIKKLWEIRSKNEVLRNISDKMDPNKTNKWPVKLIKIDGNEISKPDGFTTEGHVTIKGFRQTRWMVPQIFRIIDSSQEVLEKSLIPVAESFCKKMASIEISSSESVTDKYIKTAFNLINNSPKLQVLSLHVNNLSERHLLDVLNRLKLQENGKDTLSLSLNSSTELTSRFISEVLKTGLPNLNILVKAPHPGEALVVNRAAIVQFFENYEPAENVPGINRSLIFDTMEETLVESIFDDLKRMHPTTSNVYLENGALMFCTHGPKYWIRFEVWFPGR
ncbi:FTH domain-containing protein [Caenorhabditis elegans]|uniref:FTH domain-containing protein n=1 Tax=Caenorhabditis elegans TaxID=6239 RepID=Q9N4F6_CAEEL|nr:FTH domain-containing protein [Caenorhabditis elegans]CCD72405.2 FTH domain-containing protein [Caenorhabditis elegans]